MANRDISDKYKKCKVDFEKGLIVEYTKEAILEHRIADVFKEYCNEDDDRYFDMSLKESKEIIPTPMGQIDEE